MFTNYALPKSNHFYIAKVNFFYTVSLCDQKQTPKIEKPFKAFFYQKKLFRIVAQNGKKTSNSNFDLKILASNFRRNCHIGPYTRFAIFFKC